MTRQNPLLSSIYAPRERTALDLGEILEDVDVPNMESALAFLKEPTGNDEERTPKLPFGAQSRKAWDKAVEVRCDFTPKIRMVHRAGCWFFALWQKSVMGRTLTEIKSDEKEITHFAEATASLIKEVLGGCLKDGNWCVITTPKRRHLTRNFATLVAEQIGQKLLIPFYEDVASCRSRHRVDAVFDLMYLPPERNIILFDDFVTTGSTMKAMKSLMDANERNVILFTGINNKL